MQDPNRGDIVHRITYQQKERMEIIRSLPLPHRAAAFEQLSPYVQQSILAQLKIHEIVDLLDQLDLQQAENLIARIPNAKRRERIVSRLKGDIKEKLEYFLRFHPQATLSLITLNYLLIADSASVGDASRLIDEHYEETGKLPEVLVHHQGELVGEVPLPTLVRERNTSRLQRFVVPIPTITYQAEIPEIINTVTNQQARRVVVLDHDGSVLGIIYADAARQLFGNLPGGTLYDFAGVDDSERPFDSVRKKVSSRYKWLILNLATCFLAGSVVLSFQGTLDELTILSVYIPIIAGMGGNAATQTFAIMVRGLTLGTISLPVAGPAIWREVLAGAANGVIIGGIVALVSALWNGEPILGLVVAVALIGAHTVAGVAGAFIPLFMKHIGKDPAATSTIFITTATDVLGLFFLLGLASLVLL